MPSMRDMSQACMLSALICEDCGVEKSGDNLRAACAAAGMEVKTSTSTALANVLSNMELSDLLGNLSFGGGGGAPAAAAAAPAGATADAPAAAAPAPVEESDEDMGDFGLFD